MPDIKNLITIQDVIRYGLTQFNQHDLYFGHGTDNAWDEIIALVTHTLHLDQNIDNLNLLLGAKLLPNEQDLLLNLIEKRVKDKIPLAYLINYMRFCDLDFYVDNRVIIPRSPIAELIQNQFAPWVSNPDNISSALDLCTGSGCIAIALSYYFPSANIDAIDLSDAALEIANINIKKHNLTNQVKAIKSDLFNTIKTPTAKKYDLIISNPPYVDKQDLDNMPEEYKHEPKMALAAGDDGLDLVKIILKEAINHLNPNGLLVVEVGNSQIALENAYPKVPFTWIDFESNAIGVFALTYEQIISHQEDFKVF